MGFNTKLKIYSRIASGHCRAYPDFLIVGAQKAATTTLFHYLAQHPQVLTPLKKEIHYFDAKFSNGPLWYRAHFPLKSALGEHKITGEKSTDYIFHPLAAERIHRSKVTPRIIALLRDPVHRAVSHYHHNKRSGKENRSMQQAFDEEQAFLKKLEPNVLHNTIFHQQALKKYHRYSYLKKGLYLEQIRRYHRFFGRDELLIESTENLLANPADVLKKVYSFLDIDSSFLPTNLAPKNQGNYQKDEETDDIISALQKVFQPPNESLFDYLGQSFRWGSQLD